MGRYTFNSGTIEDATMIVRANGQQAAGSKTYAVDVQRDSGSERRHKPRFVTTQQRGSQQMAGYMNLLLTVLLVGCSLAWTGRLAWQVRSANNEYSMLKTKKATIETQLSKLRTEAKNQYAHLKKLQIAHPDLDVKCIDSLKGQKSKLMMLEAQKRTLEDHLKSQAEKNSALMSEFEALKQKQAAAA
uniref:Uncharacterized protein n=1 Tax=Chlamydomonas leiostraca TaxID=1034604 RepID=A0A7S0S6M7_9CHLO|mmetsp:Transcript_9816/g.24476  ORF Transcript_9816/g.24476 Transcript_9816/m.24476 type:complete len:187 (+) Transcript_9816:3-563(+)